MFDVQAMNETSNERRVRESAARAEIPKALRKLGVHPVPSLEIDDAIETFAVDMGYDDEARTCVNRRFLTLVITRPELVGRYFPMPRKDSGMTWFTEEAAQPRIAELLRRRGVERTNEQIGECVRAFLTKNEEYKHLQGAYEEVTRRLKEKPKAKFVGIFGKVEIEG